MLPFCMPRRNTGWVELLLPPDDEVPEVLPQPATTITAAASSNAATTRPTRPLTFTATLCFMSFFPLTIRGTRELSDDYDAPPRSARVGGADPHRPERHGFP